MRSLRMALFLEPDFVLAHFAMGSIARNLGRGAEAEKHLGNALRLLGGYKPDDALPESEGIPAARIHADHRVADGNGDHRMNETSREILKARARVLARRPAQQLEGGTTLDIVEFRLAKERYAIEHAMVREVHPLNELSPVPCTLGFIRGIINVRGQILSVIDIKKFFDLPDTGITDMHVAIIVQAGDVEFGILADEVSSVRSILAGCHARLAADVDGHSRPSHLKGVIDEQVAILDVAGTF